MAIKRGIPQIKPVYPVNIVDHGGIDSIAKQNLLGFGSSQKDKDVLSNTKASGLQDDYISAAQKVSTLPTIPREPVSFTPVNSNQSNGENETIANTTEQNPISNNNKENESLLPIQEYNEVLDRINMNKQNAKVNIETANSLANTYLSNYLKMQGTYGSGMGASAQANLGSGYQKALAEIDKNYDEMGTNALMDLNKELLSAGQKLGTSNDVANYIDSLKSQNGVSAGTLNALEMYKQSLENQENKTNIEEWRKTTLNNLNGYTTSETAQNYYDSVANNPNIDNNTKATIEAYINGLKEQEALEEAEKNEKEKYAISENYLTALTNLDNIKDFDKLFEKYSPNMTENDVNTAQAYRDLLENDENKQNEINSIEKSIENIAKVDDAEAIKDYINNSEVLSDSYKNELLEVVNQYEKALKEELIANGVTKLEPINIDTSSSGSIATYLYKYYDKEWNSGWFGTKNGIESAADKIFSLVNSNQSGKVEIKNSGTNAIVYICRGKIYWVREGSWKKNIVF